MKSQRVYQWETYPEYIALQAQPAAERIIVTTGFMRCDEVRWQRQPAAPK